MAAFQLILWSFKTSDFLKSKIFFPGLKNLLFLLTLPEILSLEKPPAVRGGRSCTSSYKVMPPFAARLLSGGLGILLLSLRMIGRITTL